MATEYKGWKVPEKIIIVSKVHKIWDSSLGRYSTDESYQGYVVDPGNKSQLETALNWAEWSERYGEYNKETHRYENEIEHVGGIHEFVNEGFTLTLLESADGSSQGGKLSFWNCKISKDGKDFIIGIASDYLLEILLHNDFKKGVCQSTLSFARCKGGVGMMNKSMPSYQQFLKDEELRASMKKCKTKKREPGMNFKAPWQSVVKMDNRVQKQSTDLVCFSSDIQEVTMKYTVNYQISSKDAMTIYKSLGTDYYNNIVVPNITESVKTEVAKYSAEALVSDRSVLSSAIQENLTQRLAGYNIIVVSASIEDMDFTDAFTDAVEAKQVAEQNKLKAQTQAEQQVIEAQAAADVKKTQADADAYEIKVKAEAEAEANNLLAASITQTLIDYKYYETWNGELPDVVGTDTIIKMPE